MLATQSLAQDLTITSFNGNGKLTWAYPTNGVANYRVEWASTLDGPWTNFKGGAVALDCIIPVSNTMTAAVPMFYRVIAVTNAYYVVFDLSGGTNATKYPASYYGDLANVPEGANSDTYKTTKLLMRLIPSGVFMMGSPLGEFGRYTNETQHQVTITQPFYIGVFEVTQKQWQLVMGTQPSYFQNLFHQSDWTDPRPVEQVSYSMIRGSSAGAGWPDNNDVDVDSFMGKLRARTGRDFDLPSEAQWEYAGRAGMATALNSGYNITNVNSDAHMSKVGRYFYNGGSGYSQGGDTSVGSAKVGSYPANAWGLYDFHGNVFEWCLDWNETYPGTVSDPRGGIDGADRVSRGGCWVFGARLCRAGFRYGYPPGYAHYDIGFRVALPPGQ